MASRYTSMMNEYEIGNAFQAIEEELMASMIRNMKRHRVEEITEEMDWSMWQAEQLKSLRSYQKENGLKYNKTFEEMNASIDGIIAKARETGGLEEEIKILEGMKQGFRPDKGAAGGISHEQFFKLNTHKLEALKKATVSDMRNAQTGILRMSNDKYRQIIFKAQVYANTGAGTYAKAVDMATKDYLEAGINCIEYKNGARHTPANYSKMCIRTASKRAKLTGEGEKRKEYGITTVILNRRGNPCPVCMPFVGKVFIDDVWSGGNAKDGPYPLLSGAIAAGLYHPNCKDGHTTYFPDMDDLEEATESDAQEANETYKGEQEAAYAARQFDKFSRLSALSLDPENIAKYQSKADAWKAEALKNPTDEFAFKMLDSEAQDYYLDLVNKEPAISQSVLQSSKKAGSNLAGFDMRLKSMGSYTEKVSKEVLEADSVKTAIGRMYDVVRFTCISEGSSLVQEYFTFVDSMKLQGYNIYRVKNTFSNPTDYRGLNVIFSSPSGDKFEVQFHTPQSFDVKNRTHAAYEEQRKVGVSEARKNELKQLMDLESRKIVAPEGIDQIKSTGRR
jgi:hypothetical protein